MKIAHYTIDVMKDSNHNVCKLHLPFGKVIWLYLYSLAWILEILGVVFVKNNVLLCCFTQYKWRNISQSRSLKCIKINCLWRHGNVLFWVTVNKVLYSLATVKIFKKFLGKPFELNCVIFSINDLMKAHWALATCSISISLHMFYYCYFACCFK